MVEAKLEAVTSRPRKLRLPTAEETARHERQRDYRIKSLEGIERKRAGRLVSLDSREDRLQRALKALNAVDDRDVTEVRIRSGFVALPKPDPSAAPDETEGEAASTLTAKERRALELASRPPATRLVNRKTNNVNAELITLYVARMTSSPGGAFVNNHHLTLKERGGVDSWATLWGLYDPTLRTRTARARRVVKGLSEADLLNPVGPRSFDLLCEDGSQQPYKVVGAGAARTAAVTLPTALWRSGWVHVLEPPELVMLLAIAHWADVTASARRKIGEEDVALPEKVRQNTFRMSDEVYESAHTLNEFGLIELRDPMPGRRRGKFKPPSKAEKAAAADQETTMSPVPYRFKIAGPDAFERDAFKIVHGCLNAPLPPRLLT